MQKCSCGSAPHTDADVMQNPLLMRMPWLLSTSINWRATNAALSPSSSCSWLLLRRRLYRSKLPPVPLQKAQVERKPAESPTSWEATARVVTTSVNAADNSDAAGSALLQGEKLFAKGDLEAARQRFEQAAKMGMPEGALALGNT